MDMHVSLSLKGGYGKHEPQNKVTLKYTVQATHIPETFTQSLKEIGYFPLTVSFLRHIFLGLQAFEQYFL